MGDKGSEASMLPSPTNPRSLEGAKWRQYLVTLAATLLVFSGGTSIGWASPSILYLKSANSTNPISEEESSWVGSLLAIGACVGALPAGTLADMIGRKMSMLTLAFPFIFSWVVIIITTALPMLYIARFIAGVALGATCAIVPIYISEIAENSIRGTLCSSFQLMLVIGILYAYSIGAACSYRLLGIFCLVCPAVFLLAFFKAPESPTYLLKNNKRKEAEESLTMLRGPAYFVPKELNTLLEDIRTTHKSSSFIQGLKKRGSVRALIISLGMMVFQQLSGINIVIFYAGSIFEDAGSTLDPDVAAIIVGAAQVVATLVSAALVDRAGRKILLGISSSVMAICLGVLGIYFKIKESGNDVSSFSMIPLVSVVVYILVFSIGFGPIPWMMSGEILPAEIKGPATGLAVALNWTLAFTVTKCFNDLGNLLGNSGTYSLLGVICIVGTFFVVFVAIETKGKSLQEIQDDLAGRRRVQPV